MKRQTVLVLAAQVLVGATVSVADLHDRGGGLIYDEDRDITWLQNANYAYTSGYDADGRITWLEALAWADQLEYGGYDDWRLPTVTNPDGSIPSGYSTLTEFGHLFYTELDNPFLFGLYGYNPTDEWPSLINTAPFQNVQLDASAWYWTSTEHLPHPYPEPTIEAYSVSLLYGIMANNSSNNNQYYAWAVRNGDVEVIPAPGAGILGSIGVGFVTWLRRRRAL